MTGAEASHDSTLHSTATLQSAAFDLEALALDDTARDTILEKAFDFRGDVTLLLSDGRSVTGYIFDRRPASPASGDAVVRLLPADSNDRLTIPFRDIRRITFGNDAAHGKTWENWVKRYVEKKLAGEAASIESESL